MKTSRIPAAVRSVVKACSLLVRNAGGAESRLGLALGTNWTTGLASLTPVAYQVSKLQPGSCGYMVRVQVWTEGCIKITALCAVRDIGTGTSRSLLSLSIRPTQGEDRGQVYLTGPALRRLGFSSVYTCDGSGW